MFVVDSNKFSYQVTEAERIFGAAGLKVGPHEVIGGFCYRSDGVAECSRWNRVLADLLFVELSSLAPKPRPPWSFACPAESDCLQISQKMRRANTTFRLGCGFLRG